MDSALIDLLTNHKSLRRNYAKVFQSVGLEKLISVYADHMDCLAVQKSYRSEEALRKAVEKEYAGNLAKVRQDMQTIVELIGMKLRVTFDCLESASLCNC